MGGGGGLKQNTFHLKCRSLLKIAIIYANTAE